MLYVDAHCDGVGGCIFHLTDDDVEEIVAALPHLKSLHLGRACNFNSCCTTVASVLSISIHCLNLMVLETHFNTLTIVDDIKRLLDGGSGRDNTKCKLRRLMVGYLPLEVHGEDVETVVVGFKVIFPCLTDLTDYGGHWHEPRCKLRDTIDVDTAVPVL